MARPRFRSQVEMADCGAAALGVVLEYHGRRAPLDELRVLTGTGRDGVTAGALVRAAEWYGLKAKGVEARGDQLNVLPPGTILFWENHHFVVLSKVTSREVVIVDPALGRRRMAASEAEASFAGVAILFEPGPDFETGGRRPAGVGRIVKPLVAEPGGLARVVGSSLLLRLVALSLPLLTAALVDRVVPTSDRNLLWLLIESLAFMVGLNFLGTWLRSRLLLELRTRVDIVTTMGFLEHLVALPYTFHLRRSAGDLMMRLRSNSAVREIITTGALSAMLDGAFVLLYLALLMRVSMIMAAVVLFFGLLQVVVLLWTRPANQRLASEGLKVEAQSQAYAFQLLSGMGMLKSSGTEARAVDEFSETFHEEMRVTVLRGRLAALVESVLGTFRMAAPLVILTVAGLQVLDRKLTLGTALAVNALAAGFLEPFGGLIAAGLSAVTIRSYVDRLNDVFESPVEQQGRVTEPAPTLSGDVRAEGASFRYAPLSPYVVQNVNLAVRPGQKVAIVGRSGSGKTTLANLLVGLFEPTEGAILHDGLDLQHLDVTSVRRQLGVVAQEPYLFGMSIAKNISFARSDLTMEEIRAAAHAACFDDDIERMPLGYDTPVGEGGSSLSGGQRQRVAIARALASRPRILLLDEATSHLDALTEAAVYERLSQLECTTIIVAHRLSTVAAADLIVVLEDGQIVEQGTHAQLLARRGAYHRLVTHQLGEDHQSRVPRSARRRQVRGEPTTANGSSVAVAGRPPS